jgi:ceramide glucosyltransferase
MFSTETAVLIALTGATVLMHLVGMGATWRRLARPAARATDLPPLTLLKPIKGLEEELEANLRSFLAQAYPAPLQVVFASTEIDDPGMAVARRVAAEHGHVDAVFVHSPGGFGLNPKVDNLRGALGAARYDHVLQSDANVRAAPGYLAAVMGEYVASEASLLGSLVVGVGERSFGAALENLQLTVFTSPGLCMAEELAGIHCVLGKAMVLRRSELEALGGLTRVKDVLAEDYVLTQIYEQAGKRVVLSTTPVFNVNVASDARRFLARHARWLKMRAVVSVPGFIADLAANPTPFALCAWLASGCDPRLLGMFVCVVAYKAFWDRALVLRLRGHGLGTRQLFATPARDLALAVLWVYALFSRTTEWRGVRLRLGRGSMLRPDDGGMFARLAQRFGGASGGPS